MRKYEEVKCIGRGSYGSAHLVIEKATGNRFVIKKIPMELLSEQEKKQSFREVDLLSKLKHPNVVEYKENFIESNVIHIVMAYCDGGDLDGRIRERAKEMKQSGETNYFSTSQILDWFVQMAMAIQYLHEQRILHRDLKASNIFLTTANVIKLGDFGIAKTLDSTLDQAKTVVGTPYYMSPEVCESKPYSYASDVWSMGCVLYEMCALKHAFDAPNILTLILRIVQQPFTPLPPSIDPQMSEILSKLLDKDPAQRPSMNQIFSMPFIRHHMQGLIASGGSLKIARRPQGTPKRRKNGRRSTAASESPTVSNGHGRRRAYPSRSPHGNHAWVPITPQDTETQRIGDEEVLLLDVSSILEESDLDIRPPARSRTPEPLVYSSDDMEGPPSRLLPPQPPPLFKRRPSRLSSAASVSSSSSCSRPTTADRIEIEIEVEEDAEEEEEEDTLSPPLPHEAGELMNPNFQNEYWNECNDSLKYYYSSGQQGKGGKGRVRPHRRVTTLTAVGHRNNGKPPLPLPVTRVDNRLAQTKPSIGTLFKEEEREPEHRALSPPSSSSWTEKHKQVSDLALSLEDMSYDGGEPVGVNLSESGLLRELHMEAQTSDEEEEGQDDGEEEEEEAYSSNSDAYEGEENFYSEHSAYSEDSDFVEENETEYSDDFEDTDAEIFEYANDEGIVEGHPSSPSPQMIKSPRIAGTARRPNEVQWVMRNVRQSLLATCD